MDTLLASCADAAALATAIAHRCPQARQHGDQWQACCPAHDDHTPSLSITPAADNVLLYCHAQCPLDAILAALGLSRRDLFVHGAAHRNGHRRIVTTYDYVDAHGVLVHQTVRLTPKAFRQRRPDPVTPGGWIWNLAGVEPVLYHLPQVMQAIQRGEPIYVVEGEKDAEALHALGLTATCNAMGTGKWRPSYSAALRGASVVILPDNDPPGYQHAREICTALAGIAARCKIVPLHTDTLHSDVSDWLHAGGTRTALEAAVEAIPWETVPSAQKQTAPPQTAPPAIDPVEVARQAAATLLQTLPTLVGDAKEDAVLDALPDLVPLDMRRWMRLKRQLKTAVPGLNMHDLGQARQELRHAAAQQASPAAGRSQAHIAAALAKAAAGQLAYDLGRQTWMAYDHGRWKQHETERVTQKVMACMDTVLQGEYTWHACAGVEHLLRARLAQTVPLETPGWRPFQNGVLCLETMVLHPHSPERPFTWQLPHAYNPQATCPQTQAWLHETVGGAHDQVQVLRAYAKAVVTRRVDLQRYLETLGPGGTGKGMYTRLLMALVGCENTVATELKHLEANRFELSQLRGKVLMVITDAERYSGPVNALKAITGQDFVRMEEKFKAQRTEVAPVMVVVAANEPVQSADYTSGLVRRRLAMTFRQRPAVPRDLLSWKAGAWHGDLAPEIPGVLNWVLALPDAQMEALLQQTTTLVPSLQATWAQSLVDTNPLAEWANQALLLDGRTNAEGKHLTVVNVGRAHKLDGTNGYEHQDRWLYPHYRAWVDDTGGKPLSSRRFTGLLRDLFENQLRLDGITHTDDMYGSRFHGLHLRTVSDAEAPCLITGSSPPMTGMTPAMTADTRVHDGCDVCDGFLQTLSLSLSPPCPVGDYSQGGGNALKEDSIHPSYLSYPSSVPSCDVMPPSSPSLTQPKGGAVSPPPVLPPPCAVCGGTAPVPPVTEALAEEPLAVGAWVWLLSAEWVQQHVTPYQIRAIAPGTDGHRYARFAETPTGWPLAQCTRADPPDTAQPPPCAVCGGTARWEQEGIWRCVTCWPLEGSGKQTGTDVAASAPGTTRGDSP
jgi:phage/plasmid-associated DNA primase/5S rRNA maturation endonuclease (ribonuclease M5)